MGQIGRFIDRCVERDPELMQRVLDRPWGTLNLYRSEGPDGEPCGCLVGSVGIEAGAMPGFEPEYTARVAGMTWREVKAIGDGAKGDGHDVIELRGRVARMAGVPWFSDEADLFTIAMLKRRIARRLGEHRVAAAVPTLERGPAMTAPNVEPYVCPDCAEEIPCMWHSALAHAKGLVQRADESAQQFVRRVVNTGNPNLDKRVAMARGSE